jgi:histidinol-phosphate aminotransferase
MAAGLAALADEDYLQRSRTLNQQGMSQITEGLTAQGYSYIPSVGNFVAFDSGRAGADVFGELLQQGVIVRPIAEYGLPNHVRVSIGLPIENERFLAALAALGSA